MIDTHAHLNFPDFDDDLSKIMQNNFQQGLEAVINVGTDIESGQKAIEISKEFDNCYVSLGLHPTEVGNEEFFLKEYQDLILKNFKKIKAIGETGLDYFEIQDKKDKQREIFLKHLQLAQEFELPIILHCRGSRDNPKDAYLDLLKIFKGLSQIPTGVVHCFSSNWEIAQEFLNLGFYIGFTGPITFKNVSQDLLTVGEKVPLQKILLETDCPFLTPEPYRGKRNEPIYIRFIAEKIAFLKNISFKEVVNQTSKNARKLFKI
jgi:TatD DNase family protein